MSKSIGLVGARGYVGAEMLTLLGQHPEFECVFACSSSQAGDLVQQHVPAAPDGLVFESLFACGGAACGVSGPDVSGYLSGNGLLTALALGHLAGGCASKAS